MPPSQQKPPCRRSMRTRLSGAGGKC
jgi:hypothetical protein